MFSFVSHIALLAALSRVLTAGRASQPIAPVRATGKERRIAATYQNLYGYYPPPSQFRRFVTLI